MNAHRHSVDDSSIEPSMLATFRRLLREYRNAALFALGLCLVAGEEGLNKAVFWAYVGIHYRNWVVSEPIARFVDHCRQAQNTIPFTALSIGICVIGSILMLIAYVRWVRSRMVRPAR